VPPLGRGGGVPWSGVRRSICCCPAVIRPGEAVSGDGPEAVSALLFQQLAVSIKVDFTYSGLPPHQEFEILGEEVHNTL